MHLIVLFGLLQTNMTDFPPPSYTSTGEISWSWSWKRIQCTNWPVVIHARFLSFLHWWLNQPFVLPWHTPHFPFIRSIHYKLFWINTLCTITCHRLIKINITYNNRPFNRVTVHTEFFWEKSRTFHFKDQNNFFKDFFSLSFDIEWLEVKTFQIRRWSGVCLWQYFPPGRH